MDDLISLAETISNASTLLADGVPGEGSTGPSNLLQVVAIGTMGAGKSSVLNTLIGHPVLPTADGGATRFPLIINLERNQHIADGGVRGKLGAATNLLNAGDIRKALQSDMKRFVPSSSRGQEDNRLLIVQSATAPPLRLIDLPGLEARASEQDNMVLDNTASDALILVIIPANGVKEASVARVLKMASDLDSSGTRLVGVITKLDVVADDKAAIQSVIEFITGQGPSIAQDYPWVAVMGQPTPDVTGDSLAEAWVAESKILGGVVRSTGAKGLEASLGREALVRTLARQMRKRMKDRIPRILTGLEERSVDVEDELLRLGDTVLATTEGARAVALELCRGFDTKFVENIEGGEVTEEADGYQPYLTSPENGLRQLIKRCLDLAKKPGLQCVDEVHKILMDTVTAAGSSAPSLVRFSGLKTYLVSIASAALEDYRVEARLMVNNLVDMERIFIPPGHFIDAAARRHDAVLKSSEAVRKRGVDVRRSNSETSLGGGGEEGKQPGRMAAAMQSLRGKKEVPPSPPQAPMQELAGFLYKVSSKNDWSKRWFALSDKTCRLYYVKKPDEKTPRGVIPLEECVVEDIVGAEELPPGSATSDPLRGGSAQPSAQSLAFKISNKVPYKTVVKVHHNLILRAENLAEKQQWVLRIRALTRSKESDTQGAEGAEPEDLSPSPNGPPPPPPNATPTKGAPPAVPDTKPGGARPPPDPEEELKYMAQEVRFYVEAVLGHLSGNIPKAIVLSQVEKAKDSMLTKLYVAVSSLTNERIEELLTEDVDSKSKREKAQKQQDILGKLKRMLSLHEARANAEEANAAPQGKDQPLVEDWRVAFQKAGKGREEDYDKPSPPQRGGGSSRGPSSSSNVPTRPGKPAPPPPVANGAPASANAPRQASPMRQSTPPPPPPPEVSVAAPGPPMRPMMRSARPPPPPPGARF